MTTLSSKHAPLFLALALAPLAARADMRSVARELVASHSDAVIEVEVVQEFSMSQGGQAQTQENEDRVSGVVVDAAGTVVASLSSLDPSSLMDRVRGEEAMRFTTKVKDTRYILADGTEVPATIILRDPDLDIAVLKPRDSEERTYTFIDTSTEAMPGILSPVFTIGRAGRIANRTPTVRSGEIIGMVERPRTYFLPSQSLEASGAGAPVFGEQGEFMGMVLLRALTNAPDNETPIAAVVIPAIDIREALRHATEEPTPPSP